ncbi:hypothetical protein Tco_1211684 [Tanacetum coccineum]
MESSNSNSKERELQLTQRLAKQRHSICMTWFEQLETHLHDLYLLNSPYAVDAFKPAFRSFFGEEHQTFKLKMFHNLDQLRLQLERENLHGVNAKTCLQALRTQFKEFLASKGVNATDLLNQGWQQDFEDFTRCEPSAYRRELLENLDTLEAVIHRVVNTYGVLRMKENEAQINPVQAVDDSLNVSKSSWIESENHNALSKSMNETQLQQHESLVTESTTLEANLNTDVKALDDGSVITESSETKSDMHDTSSSSRTYITHVVDANIRPVNDQVPSAEVHLTAPHNVLANEQKHTDQSEPRYDTYLLEKVDSNTTPDSTNMCHRGGEIDQDAKQYQAKSPLLKAEFLKTNDMVEKEAYNELSNRFLQLEKHCISLEISMQQKEESLQTTSQNHTDLQLEESNKKREGSSNEPRFRKRFFANVALKNELRKLKGNNMDTKFAKPSILGKPVLQPPRNQSVVRQLNAFKSERPNFSKPRFASQVDVNDVLSKPVTPYYLPKVREYVLAKPHHVIAPGSFRNSQEEPYGSNDMAHNHYLEEARKKTQERNRIQNLGEGEGDDADMERAIKLSLDPAFLPQGRAPVGGVTIRDPVSETTSKLHEVVGKGKAVVTEEQVAHSLIDLSKKKRTTDQFILVRRDQTPHDSTTGPSSQPENNTSEKVFYESSSTSDSERTESETEAAAPKGDKDQGEVDTSTVTSGVSIPVSDPEKAHEALAGPDPEPMKEDQTGSDSGKLHVSLAGPNPEHMDDEFLATAYPKVHENLKLITDERVIDDKPESHSGSMSSMKNLDDTYNFGDQFLYDKPTEDDQEKSKVREESDSTIPDPSHQTVTSTPPVIAPFTDVSSTKPSSLVTTPPINTEATTITTSLPEITPFIALQLRVARLEQEMSEVKKTDHSADVLASIKSQVPTAVDKYLGTKLDDALLKILERHTADLIEKYSVLPGPESVKNQESEKSPKEIIRAKKEQGEEKQDSTYSIRSTDKVDLEEFDLKSALFKHMNKIKSANRNTANYHLYHALMEALIADEDAMDKEVADKVKDHKRKHDSDDDEDDDDDEGPSAGSNQGRSTKRRRSDSAASGSAQPPPKDDDQSSKKPRESDASASKQHPSLTTSTGWQITDTRDAVVKALMHM